MIKLTDVAKTVFAFVMLITPALYAGKNNCVAPQFGFYGKRLDGFAYKCIKRLGSRPGITPPCAEMCPLNVTFAYPIEGAPFIHIIGVEEGHVDYRSYITSIIFANCTLGILQAVWYGPAITLFAGYKTNQSMGEAQHRCSATPDPMPCSCEKV